MTIPSWTVEGGASGSAGLSPVFLGASLGAAVVVVISQRIHALFGFLLNELTLTAFGLDL
jgi:hypothetical protein